MIISILLARSSVVANSSTEINLNNFMVVSCQDGAQTEHQAEVKLDELKSLFGRFEERFALIGSIKEFTH
jgi:hypothetical protein